jgi:hypothetical protein
MGNVSFVIGAVGTLMAAVTLLAVSHLVACSLLPTTRTSVRLTGAVTICLGLYGLVFYALILLGNFHAVGGLLAFFVLLGGGWIWRIFWHGWGKGSKAGDLFVEDVKKVCGSVDWAYSGKRLWISVPVSLLVGANFLRSLVIPPLAWDSLTYHLVRAALWIRDSGLSDYDAPGAWQDYQTLMPLGDALSAGIMILPSSDALVPLLWFGVWCFFGLSVYAAGRCLGADRAGASLGAIVACLVPAVSGGMFVAYVDNLVGALAVASFALLLCDDSAERKRSTLLAMLALGGALAAKKTALPFVGAGLLVLICRSAFESSQHGRTLLKGVGAMLLLAGPPMGYLWAAHGSPLHPWVIDPAGWIDRAQGLFLNAASSPETAGLAVNSGGGKWEWLKYLIFKGYGTTFPLSHLGYGPAGPLIGLLGIFGYSTRFRQDIEWRTLSTLGAFLLAGAVAVAAVVQYPKLDPNLARYSIGTIGIVGVGVACLNSRWIRYLLSTVILGQLLYVVPVHWGPSDTTALLYWLVLSVPAVVVSGLILFWAKGRQERERVTAVTTAILIGLTATVATLEPVRGVFRYDIYEEASEGLAYSNHPLVGADSFESSNLWSFLEGHEGANTAISVGWALDGLNWFVYPFFGSRLQNGISYVPVTQSGQLMQLREKRERAGMANPGAWRARLEDAGVDFVGVLVPSPIEVQAMRTYRSDFQLVARGPHPGNMLFRFAPRRQ